MCGAGKPMRSHSPWSGSRTIGIRRDFRRERGVARIIATDHQAEKTGHAREALRGELERAVERLMPLGQRVCEEGEIRMLQVGAGPRVIVLQREPHAVFRERAALSKLT